MSSWPSFAAMDRLDYPRAVMEQGLQIKEEEGYDLRSSSLSQQGTVLNSTFTARVKPAGELLPAPHDGNDLFYSQLLPWDQRLHLGSQPLGYSYFFGAARAVENIWTRFKAQPHFGFFYDTGAFNNNRFDVGSIAVGDDPRAGQVHFTGSDNALLPVSVLGDAQLLNFAPLGGSQVQIFAQANNHRELDELQLEHLFVRAWNYDRLTVSAGQAFSLFGVGGALPGNLTQSSILVGTGEIADRDKPLQLRIQRTAELGGWGWGVAVEDPKTPDFTAPSGNELTRWPTFVATTAYNGEDGVDRIQFSAMTRNIGFESATRQEFFTAGYGLAGYAVLGSKSGVNDSDRQGFYIGVAGGEAVGHYIHGITRAAEFTGTDLTSLSAIGTYVGYKREWENCNGISFGTNVAYGYAAMEATPAFGTNVDQELQQAWANLIVFPSNNMGFGFEYQYGRRETHAGVSGENHRFLIIAAFTTSGAATGPGGVRVASAASAFDTGQTGGNAALQRF